jgi:hypothetical protein
MHLSSPPTRGAHNRNQIGLNSRESRSNFAVMFARLIVLLRSQPEARAQFRYNPVAWVGALSEALDDNLELAAFGYSVLSLVHLTPSVLSFPPQLEWQPRTGVAGILDARPESAGFTPAPIRGHSEAHGGHQLRSIQSVIGQQVSCPK